MVLRFPLTDWEAEHWQQLGPFHAWRNARHVWSKDHGDALGNPLELLTFERAIRLAHYSAIRSSASLPNPEEGRSDG